jgi:transposase
VLWSRAYHRVRSRLVSRRTATVNQIRAFLIEQGVAVRSGLHALRASLKSRADEISARMAALIVGLYDWLWLDERIGTITAEIETFATEQPACRRLMSVPGVGPVISIAMVAAVGDTEPRINR